MTAGIEASAVVVCFVVLGPARGLSRRRGGPRARRRWSDSTTLLRHGMDFSIAHALDRFSVRHDGFEDPLRAYVMASEYLFLALIAVLVVIAVVRRDSLTRSVGVVAAASAGVALLVAKVVGDLVDRPRPFVAHPSIHDFLAHAPDAGMPSDHATAAFAIGTAILLVHRRAGAIVLLAAAVLAIGRVFLGVHYLSDIAAGAALGSAVAIAMTWLARRLPDVRSPLPPPRGAR